MGLCILSSRKLFQLSALYENSQFIKDDDFLKTAIIKVEKNGILKNVFLLLSLFPSKYLLTICIFFFCVSQYSRLVFFLLRCYF